MQHLLDYSKRGPYDEIDTPAEALEPLLPHLQEHWRWWEAAWGKGVLAKHMRSAGLSVVGGPTKDFFEWEPGWWDGILTNPPFSLKRQWLKRCYEIGKPWALLLPVTALGAGSLHKYLGGCELIFLPRRVDFTGGKAPWFAVCWVTWGLDIGEGVTFYGQT